MKFKNTIPEASGFQLTAMLDVVFLLLIFFVVTQNFILNEQDMKVKVPTAANTTEEQSRAIEEIIINVREENDELIITIDREIFTRDDLLSLMQRMVAVNPNQAVRIRGDAEARWQKIVDVISTCSQAGVWNISFSKQLPKPADQ